MTGVTYQNCISPPSFREETKNHVTVNLYGTGSFSHIFAYSMISFFVSMLKKVLLVTYNIKSIPLR